MVAAERFLLLADQLDGLGGFGGVELRALGRHDHKIGSADRVGHRHRGRAFQIDNHKRASLRRVFDRLDDRCFRDIGENGQVLGTARPSRPLGYRSVRVGVNRGDRGAFESELGREDNGGGGFSRASLGACEDDDWHVGFRVRVACVHIVERKVIGRSTESYLVAGGYPNSDSYQVAIGKHALIRGYARGYGSSAFVDRSRCPRGFRSTDSVLSVLALRAIVAGMV